MSQLRILAPKHGTLETIAKPQCDLRCFDPLVLDFIDALSQQLLKTSQAKQYPELIALGFWLRKGNIKKMQQLAPQGIIKPLGWVMHFTPANVDTMFVYSWICSLLMGNHNVVRVATKASDLKDCLLGVINTLFDKAEFEILGCHNLFVHYDKHTDHSARLSLQADVRVIWGGDDSVNGIRNLPCKPRCRDVSFADRYSACVINATQLSTTKQQQQLANKLLKDSQPYQQQACSSPRVVFWVGSEDNLMAFGQTLDEISSDTEKSLTRTNNRLVYTQLVKSEMDGVEQLCGNNIGMLHVPQLTTAQRLWHSGEGLYLVKVLTQLEDVAQYADEKLQTLSYWGFEKDQLLKLLTLGPISGLDRVVPVGQALDFSPVWDGFDLFNQLCRRVILE